MIGRQDRWQEDPFVAGPLSGLIPVDHILKLVDRVLDLSWLRDKVRDEVRELYSERHGRPVSDDPTPGVVQDHGTAIADAAHHLGPFHFVPRARISPRLRSVTPSGSKAHLAAAGCSLAVISSCAPCAADQGECHDPGLHPPPPGH